MGSEGREASNPASSDAVEFSGGLADWVPASGRRLNLRRLLLTPDGALSRGLVLSVAALFTVPTAVYFWKYEGGAANRFFVSSVTLTLAACMALAFRRVLVASVLVNALVGTVATMAWAKHQTMDMVLHAYDIVFYLSSASTIAFLWRDFRIYVIALIAVVLATAIAAATAYWFDAGTVRRRTALVAAVLLAFLSVAAAEVKGERRHAQYYLDGLYVSSFYHRGPRRSKRCGVAN